MILKESIEMTKQYAFDHLRAQLITKAIGEMIPLDNEPFNLVDHIGFMCLMKLPEPRYKLPSDKYFSEHLILEHGRRNHGSYGGYSPLKFKRPFFN